jgi:hypothetical protein
MDNDVIEIGYDSPPIMADVLFRSKWRFHNNVVRNQFSDRVRTYLLEELLVDRDNYTTNDWCRYRYVEFFDKAQARWKRNCSNDRFVWDITVLPKNTSTQERLNAFANNLRLPNSIVRRIKQCKEDGKHYTAVYIVFRWNRKGSNGHGALLLFDLVDNLQWYFDPDDVLESDVSVSKAFSQKSYVDDFAVVSAETIAETYSERCIQQHFEQFHPGQNGTCGMLCAIILMCCLRFNYWNTKSMARIICKAIPTEQQKKDVIQKFITWFLSFLENEDEPDVLTNMLTVNSVPGSKCAVFKDFSKTLCDNDPIPVNGQPGQYCTNHKNMLLN